MSGQDLDLSRVVLELRTHLVALELVVPVAAIRERCRARSWPARTEVGWYDSNWLRGSGPTEMTSE